MKIRFAFQICEISEFGPLLEMKYIFNGPSITNYCDHFVNHGIKMG